MGTKRKNNLNVFQPLLQVSEVDAKHLFDSSDPKSTFLPKGIIIDDLDIGLFNELENGELSLTLDGEKTPYIFMTNERWGEFEKTWVLMNQDKNLVPPFITVRRIGIGKGTYAGEGSSVPNRHKFTYIRVPNFDGELYGYDVYSIPQPTPVDLSYEVMLFTKYAEDVNRLAEKYLNVFHDFQRYIKIENQFMRIELIEKNFDFDNEMIEDINNERMYKVSIPLVLKGRLMNPDDFKIVKTFNRLSASPIIF